MQLNEDLSHNEIIPYVVIIKTILYQKKTNKCFYSFFILFQRLYNILWNIRLMEKKQTRIA